MRGEWVCLRRRGQTHYSALQKWVYDKWEYDKFVFLIRCNVGKLRIVDCRIYDGWQVHNKSERLRIAECVLQ